MDFLGRQAHAGILSNQREQILSCLVVLVLALLSEACLGRREMRHHSAAGNPNLYTDALTGSATFWSLGAAPLRIPAARESHRDLRATHHAREGVGSWGLPGFSRRVSEKSGPLNDPP